MRRQEVWLSLLLMAIVAGTARGDDLGQEVCRARQAMEEQNFAAAIQMLERALPRIEGDRSVLLLLRSAYRAEARRLVETGDRNSAQRYLDRLQLLEQVPPEHKPDRGSPDSTLARDEKVKVVLPDASLLPRVASQQSVWRPVKEPSTSEHVNKVSAAPGATAPSARVLAARPARVPPPSSLPAAGIGQSQTTSDQPRSWIKQADALFVAGRYIEAGELYEKANDSAPETLREARDRWLYCRLARVVRTVNETPPHGEHWPAIQQDAQAILGFLPNSDFAQSLRQIAAPSQDGTALASTAGDSVVRASEPDRPAGKDSNLLAGLASRIGLSSSQNKGRQSILRRSGSGAWQVVETSNFRVHATDDSLAGQIADIAECTRIELYRTWYGGLPQSNWTPKCDIYVHNSAEQYARVTRQGSASPGHSQTGIERGRIASRRVDLRRDGTDVLYAVLPHEITHVVIADRFTAKPMPRWADEGMAVLTEPLEKKRAHLRNLGDYMKRGHVYSASQLMTMADYPSGANWPMFYAESVCMVEFLVERGGAEKFIEFMEQSVRGGYESALNRVYGLAGFEELDRTWNTHRTQQVAKATGIVTAQTR